MKQKNISQAVIQKNSIRQFRFRFLLTLATLSLLLLVQTHTVAKDKWVKIESKNFILVGNANEKEIKKVALKLEQFRQTLSLLLPKAKFETTTPTFVYVFEANRDFDDFKPLYKGKTRKNVGGYFLKGPDANYIALSIENKGKNLYDIIFHEYFHFITDNNIPNIPLWLNEGLAEYYSSFEMSDDGKSAKLGLAIPRHVYTLRDVSLIPLKKLFAVNHKSPEYNESDKAGIFYAQSWALVHYLLLGNESKRKTQFLRLIDLTSSVTLTDENFQQTFQADYKQMEKELVEYVGKFTFPYMGFIFKNEIITDKTLQSIVLGESEKEQKLGELQLWVGRLEDAEKRLTSATKLDPKYASAQISLAMLRWRQGNPFEAKKLYEQAAATDANNYLAHYYLGQFLFVEGDVNSALKSFQTSISLKPDIARSHLSLALLYERIGDENQAVASYETAIKLNPRNADFYKSQSYILLRLGNNHRAAVRAMSYLSIKGWLEEFSPYVALTAYFGYRRAQFNNADLVLDTSLKRFDTSEWPYPVFQYLKREITAEQLLAQATTNDKMTEARAYLGLDLATDGKSQEAMPHLLWVKENGNRRFIEYPLALAEIKRLEKSQTNSSVPPQEF
jgi:tetratricopeptide (TPR) repeat protein